MKRLVILIGILCIGFVVWKLLPVKHDAYGNCYLGSGKYCTHQAGLDFCIYDDAGLCVRLHTVCAVNATRI